ncbi:LuxR C-terminal-related transcriptional regulator [Nocardioides humi]|uniref:HTH luxR-type domain-containing protein n=1 Tax=Nocardioides humi TaxID=449461 RepID=A0ABN1ZUK4_9ACTN|nr:LuxR family transcriptional regulator [Nocardioides humi]
MGTLLVAREDEVDAVRASLTASPAGIVVFGETGVGKTALVHAALAGRRVREGGCLATLSWAPYLAFRRAFGDDLPDECWAGDAEYAAERIERALGDDILHVDDVQWADPDTRRVLHALVGRVRLVATVRRGDPGAADPLEQLTAAGLGRLNLEPLEPADAGELVRRLRPALTPSEVTSLVERSGGNPLLLEELADADADIATLHRAVLARCRQLPEPQVEDLALLALAGQPLAATDLDDAAGLVESGIVVHEHGSLTIRHALIGEVIDDLLTEERQLRAHRRLADLLTHPGQRARHLLAAGELEAAHAAAMRAVAEALTPGERIAHLGTAARCVDPVEGAEFRLRAAEEASAVDLLDVAASLLDGLPDRPDLRFRVARQRYAQAVHVGDTAALPGLAARMADLAAPGTGEEVLALMDLNYAILTTTGSPEGMAEALGVAERAMARAEEVDAERSAALKAFADTLLVSGDDRWRDAMPRALARARAEGNLAREWRIASNWVEAYQSYGPLAEGLALADETAARFDALRLVAIRRNFEFHRFELLHSLADYPAIIDGVPELLRAPGLPALVEVDLHCILAEAELQTGQVEDGLARLASGPPTSTERGQVEVHRILAETHLDALRGDLAAEQLAALDRYDLPQLSRTMVAPTRAWTARALGEPAPRRPDLLPETGMLSGVAPELDGIDAVRRDDFTAAARHFRIAAERYRDGFVPRMVRCLWFVGEALRLAADPAAEAALIAAEDESRSHGMVAIRVHCERSLRLLGVRRSAVVARSGDSPLTEREHEVSLLVADGLTDADIGSRLGLQRRTVQTLLANARAKLGAENRAHLVRLVTEDAP